MLTDLLLKRYLANLSELQFEHLYESRTLFLQQAI